LDLQGYELEALQGASATLRKVGAVLLEASFEPMYKGEPSFQKIEDFLKGKGFCFNRALDFLKDSHGNILQMDALFTRR
ncbi:MAG TPA: FkbM family methyltransferase, partial [bacterium]